MNSSEYLIGQDLFLGISQFIISSISYHTAERWIASFLFSVEDAEVYG